MSARCPQPLRGRERAVTKPASAPAPRTSQNPSSLTLAMPVLPRLPRFYSTPGRKAGHPSNRKPPKKPTGWRAPLTPCPACPACLGEEREK